MKFFWLLMLLPGFLLGQYRNIKWKKYSNPELHFSMSIPESSYISKPDYKSNIDHYFPPGQAYNSFYMQLPKIQHSKTLDRHELQITVINSDSCCYLMQSAFTQMEAYDSSQEMIKGKKIYEKTFDEAAMGGRVCQHTTFTLCDTADNFCFAFSSMIYYQLPRYSSGFKSNRKSNSIGFDIKKELSLIKKIIASINLIKN